MPPRRLDPPYFTLFSDLNGIGPIADALDDIGRPVARKASPHATESFREFATRFAQKQAHKQQKGSNG